MRVAVCLTGLLRCFREAWPNISSVLVKPFQADVFVHTWSDLGYWVPGDSAIKRGFLETGVTVTPEALQAFYGAQAVAVEDFSRFEPDFERRAGNFPTWYARPKNTVSLFYKMSAGLQMVRDHAAARGFAYDVVIRTRPDMVYGAHLPSMSINNFNCLWHRNHKNTGLGDNLHVSSFANVLAFSTGIYQNMEGLYARTGALCPHLFVAEQLRELGIPVNEFSIPRQILHTPGGEYKVLEGSEWRGMNEANYDKLAPDENKFLS